MEIPNCNHCGKEVKKKTPTSIIEFIKHISEENNNSLCKKCAKTKFKSSSKSARERSESLKRTLNQLAKSIPVLTIPNPIGWTYSPIGYVSYRSNAGTGLMTEFTSDLKDLVGGESNSMNAKILQAETKCAELLRKKLLQKEQTL